MTAAPMTSDGSSGFDPAALAGRAVLAPLAGITDSPFRSVCRRHGAAMVWSEMLSAEALARDHGKTMRMAAFRPEERPVVLQLFGTRPAAFAAAIARLEGLAPDAFDLNFGCPAPKIVKHGGGSALLREPAAVAAIARAAVAATRRPVFAKIRSGWEVGGENAVEIARQLEQCGAAAIAVHGRTKSQLFAGAADWAVIGRVRQAVGVPVIGNGDVVSGTAARRMIAETGCDLVMVGRGALGNPWIFSEINDAVGPATTVAPARHIPWTERLVVITEHMDLMAADKGERRAVLEMRKHLGWYTKGIPGAAATRRELMTALTRERVMELLRALGHGGGISPDPERSP
ncbi:MAG: tRNA dihydrouridine synthase DusB [Candidatus Edwardsbacteria bacterium]|jgi:nifR3 family TIM-barrel protein|nr:tRNA dihydrouridine synthase DusB [Candidatus Edwardsbacteria bacterium]